MTWYEATGIPITPWDDAGRHRPYPIVRVVATEASSSTRTETVCVLPVSEEMDCRKCHGSNAGFAARPAAGWVDDPVPKRDYRLNILRLHDERNLGKPLYGQALAAAGLSALGLYDQVVRVGHPVLCASCHASEALAAGGVAGVPALTRAVHHRHATVIAPDTGLELEATNNRTSCYQCHPGSATRCLCGAMGSAVALDGSAALQCQSCHGSMNQVGAANRIGWLDEPNCQSCHTGTATNNNGAIRFLTSLNSDGTLRIDAFEQPGRFKMRLQDMADRIRRQPRQNPDVSVQVPGDPEKAQQADREVNGIPINAGVLAQFETIARELDIEPLRS